MYYIAVSTLTGPLLVWLHCTDDISFSRLCERAPASALLQSS